MKFIVLYEEIDGERNLDTWVILEITSTKVEQQIFGPDPKEMIRAMTEYGLSCYDIKDARIFLLRDEFILPQELVDELMRDHDEAFQKTMERVRGKKSTAIHNTAVTG